MVIEDFIFVVYFTLNCSCCLQGWFFYSLLLPGKRSKSPGTRDASGGSAFVQKLPCGNILQSVASLVARVFSSVFRVLRNSFSYPHFVRITHTQTVIAFGELWLHSLCNLQVNLRYARLHKLSRFSKNHWRRLPKSLMRTNQAMLHSMNNRCIFLK